MVLSMISGGALAGSTAYSGEFSRGVVSGSGGGSFGAMTTKSGQIRSSAGAAAEDTRAESGKLKTNDEIYRFESWTWLMMMMMIDRVWWWRWELAALGPAHGSGVWNHRVRVGAT